MSQIRVDSIVGKTGLTSPTFEKGLNISGILTATTFDGNVTGDVTGNVVGNVTGNVSGSSATAGTSAGLTGTPNITVGDIQAANANFSGDVTVVGDIDYENVTNVNSVGIVTAGGGFNTKKMLSEEANVTAGKLSDNQNIDLENGMIHVFTTTETTTSTPNLRYNGSTTLDSKIAVGETIAVTIVVAAATAGYADQITMDGQALTERWIGGSAPTTGGISGVDVYSYTIIKVNNSGTLASDYTVIANLITTS